MTPIYATLFACICAGCSFLGTPQQVFLAVLAFCGVGGLTIYAKWNPKRDRGMCNFMWGVLATWGAFVLMVRMQVIPLVWVFSALGVCLAVLGGLWWFDEYNRHRVKIERDMERWPILAEKLHMPQVRRGPEKKTDTGRRWRFWWSKGDFTLAQFKAAARGLESALDIPPMRIRFEEIPAGPGMSDPNACWVTENTKSPILEQVVSFDQPTMNSFTDMMFVGLKEDGSRHEVCWFERGFGGMHTLAAGSPGSGKSGLYHLVLAESARCPDMVRWGIDAKGGMALRPWASLFDWMIDDVDQSVFMMQAIHDVLKARSKYSAERGWDVWKPDALHPILVLFVDEAAEVFGLSQFDINELASSVARMGRATGVVFLLATQYPTMEALGSTQLMKNVRRRFCFSVEDAAAQRAVIPKSTDIFDATSIPIGKQFVGTFYASEGGLISELSGRVRYVTPSDVYRLVLEVGSDPTKRPNGSTLDQISVRAAIAGSVDAETGECYYRERRIWTVSDAIPPDEWVGDNADDITGERVETEPAPPMHPSAPDPAGAPINGHPVHRNGFGAPGTNGAPVHERVHLPDLSPRAHADSDEPFPGAPAPGFTPWREDTASMDPSQLDQLVAPRNDAEAVQQEAERIAYYALFDDQSISPADAIRLLNRMLDAAPPGGITIAQMRETLKRSPSWYSEALRVQIRDGKVIKPDTGFYARPAKATPGSGPR
jgi:hypothetical protein